MARFRERQPPVSSKGRLVYSTEKGRICPKCGWPADDCRCSSSLGAPEAPVPDKVKVALRLEKRVSGKNVTVVAGLPRNRPFLQALLKELKKSCSAGGRADDGALELQGDQRERLRELLGRRGWTVKG
jgi:translation initiation factor 1